MTIGNKFMVSSIQDGTTIHGNLVANKSLTQAWNGDGATPDWTDSANQPDISLLVYDGGTQKSIPDAAEFTWTYNGSTITFGNDGYNTAMTGVAAATFYKHSATENGVKVQKLKICKNLASSANKDLDIIGFNGSVEIDGNYIGFSASIQVRITEITANGYVGVLEYLNGKTTIEEQSESVKILASLFGGNAGSGSPDTYYVKWYVNGVATTTNVVDSSSEHSITLSGAQVVDYATVKAEFYLTRSGNTAPYSYSDLVYTEVAGVDDVQDPEFMEVAADGPTALRVGDSMTFLIWVRNKNTNLDDSWNSFKVQLLDSERNVITGELAGDIPNVISGDQQGWRQLNIYDSGDNVNKAHIGFTYQVVNEHGNNIQGIIVAEQVQNP